VIGTAPHFVSARRVVEVDLSVVAGRDVLRANPDGRTTCSSNCDSKFTT
jgi:hypothetical protein